MPNALKQSGVKATASLKGRFHHVRVRLTTIYVALLAAILFLSSYTIYASFSNQLEHRFHGDPAELGTNYSANGPRPYLLSDGTLITPPSPDDVRADLIRTLITVNGLLLIGAGIFSYWLAGITLEPIQESYDRQCRFLGDASHELRTPLSILKTDLENELDDQKTKGENRERAESHLEEVERMSSLVSDLLGLSRLDEQVKTSVSKKEEDLNLLISEAVERLKPIALHHQVTLKYSNDMAKKIEILTNKEFIAQALGNVIKNAILYNTENGTVTVTTEIERSQVKIKIEDTGIGIAESDLKNIFERFYRIDKSRSRASGGSGLGLSIVQSAIDNVGGTVQISSELGKGTVVTILLPIHHSS